MGAMYDTVWRIEAAIARKNLPLFRTRGLIAIEVGFSLSLIDEATPDDAVKIAALAQAAQRVLGEPFGSGEP